MLAKYPTGSGRPLDLFLFAIRDAYHARGYLDCSVVPHPKFNESTHIVNYGLEIVAGHAAKQRRLPPHFVNNSIEDTIAVGQNSTRHNH